MSLTFSASTDKINVGSNAVLDDLNTGTYMAWVRPTAIGTYQRIYQKGYGSGYHIFAISTYPNLVWEIHRATVNLQINAAVTTTTLVNNTWSFVAVSFDAAGADSAQFLYSGSLTQSAAEVSSYLYRQVGSGSLVSDASMDGIIGNKANNSGTWKGVIAWVGAWNRQLTLGEIKSQQFRPHVTAGCVGFWHLTNAATVPDWSGQKNNGTVSGATVSAHVPLRPWFGKDAARPYSAVTAPAFRPAWAVRTNRLMGGGL